MKLLILALAFVSQLVTSTATQAEAVRMESVQAELITENKNFVVGDNWAALVLTHDNDWHTYYKNAGDAGIATNLTFDLSDDVKVSEFFWPTPHKLSFSADLVNYGYEGLTILPFKVNVPEAYLGRKVSMKADLSLKANLLVLMCKDICLPGTASFDIKRDVSRFAVEDKTSAYLFKKAFAKLPSNNNSTVSAVVKGDNVEITIPTTSAEIPKVFIPSDEGIINDSQAQAFSKTSNGYKLVLEKDMYLDTIPENFGGVLIFSDDSAQAYGNSQLPDSLTAVEQLKEKKADNTGAPSFIAMLFFAFIGGLILNLMPCVLPVLSLKVMSLVKYKDTGAGYIHGLYYTAGVMISFLALAGVLVSLRESGEALGWGFQLQNASFVVFLISLLTLLALSLFGVFNFGATLARLEGQKVYKSGTLNSFMGGVLATIVATPCTAPFMGAAMAYALSQSAFVTFSVFAMLAFGLAFPYLLLSFKPAALKFMPKPGVWMESFKQFLGFPMAASVVWLLWVLSAQKGVDAVLMALILVFILSFLSWVYGRFISLKGGKIYRTVSLLLVLATALIAVISVSQSVASIHVTKETVKTETLSFDKARIKKLNAEGKTVFLRFTANWCITCKVNESLVIKTEDVQNALNEAGVIQMIADWTNKDAVIAKEIESFGRSGIPLYVFYRPEGKTDVLPEVITKQMIIDKIK